MSLTSAYNKQFLKIMTLLKQSFFKTNLDTMIRVDDQLVPKWRYYLCRQSKQEIER